jgi:hypothetical protein
MRLACASSLNQIKQQSDETPRSRSNHHVDRPGPVLRFPGSGEQPDDKPPRSSICRQAQVVGFGPLRALGRLLNRGVR